MSPAGWDHFKSAKRLSGDSQQIQQGQAREDSSVHSPTSIQTASTAKDSSAKDPVGALVVLVLLVISIGLIIWGVSSALNGGSSTPEPKHSDVAALVMCEEFVKDNLKSPSTASFPFEEGKVAPLPDEGDGHYIVRGAVDAQNSFGAMLRTQYYCKVHYEPSTDKWVLDALLIE
jgi:hypothetical protein